MSQKSISSSDKRIMDMISAVTVSFEKSSVKNICSIKKLKLNKPNDCSLEFEKKVLKSITRIISLKCGLRTQTW